MTTHHQPTNSDPIAGLESEVLPRLTAGNRLPATNNVRLSYARARMRRELEARHGRGAWRTRPWATLAPALAGAAALWAALAALFAAHPIAAAGLAAGLILSGGIAADVTNIGPPILETIGLQQATDAPGADHRSPAAGDALQQNTLEQNALPNTDNGAPGLTNTEPAGTGNGPTTGPPADTHGATVAPIARSNGDPAPTATDGETHGDIVACTASAQGQTASANENNAQNANPTTGVSQSCNEPTLETTSGPNGTGPNEPGANRNLNANANANANTGGRPGNLPHAP